MSPTIFLFGEAERGEFCIPLFCHTLPQLAQTLGNPPNQSQGIVYAVQALLYKRMLIYFRVKEEGFSVEDYQKGLDFLKNREKIPRLDAICMPGVGDGNIIEATSDICALHNSFLIIDEKDLYDYLTGK